MLSIGIWILRGGYQRFKGQRIERIFREALGNGLGGVSLRLILGFENVSGRNLHY